MQYRYLATLTPCPDGRIEARVPDLPLCVAHGADRADAARRIEIRARQLLRDLETSGRPAPRAGDPVNYALTPGALIHRLRLETDGHAVRGL